ncbi:LysR family transcriptional regulator ArgP [Nocardioides sp. HB32]
MDLVPSQLAALVAIADHGTFEAAARHLHVTPSAVSQRIRALESSIGRVVVQRTTPCRPTPDGEVLLRLARQVQLLHDEVNDALAHSATNVDLPVAVNADSLATWFRGVVGEVAGWVDVALRLHVEDQAFSAGLLRSGDVLAAVTSEPGAVQGCSVERLGTLRYVPAAAPALAERWRRGRGPDWAAMPMVVFNEKDALQHDVLAGRGVSEPPVVHRVPTSADFLEAVCLGLGWGMVPEPQLGPAVAAGRVVPLAGRLHVDVPLHWQRWRLDSPVLDRLTDAVRRSARSSLRAPETPSRRSLS